MTRKLLITCVAVLAAACGSDAPPLVASDVAVKPPMPGMKMTAGYLILHNNTGEDITIDRVTSPQFGKVEMHETIIEDGVSRMSRLDEVVLPAGEAVQFKPGGKHLMLMRPDENLDVVTLELHSGDAVVLTVSVSTGG